jgi:hypothetical protein
MTSAVALAIGRWSGNDNINRGAERKILFALNDGKRFVARADEKLTAFVELEAEISHAQASAEPVAAYQARPYKNLIKLRYNSANCLKQVIFCANSPEHKR